MNSHWQEMFALLNIDIFGVEYVLLVSHKLNTIDMKKTNIGEPK